MSERNVLLFISFWFSLFFLSLAIFSKFFILDEINLIDGFLVVLLSCLISFDIGKRLVFWLDNI